MHSQLVAFVRNKNHGEPNREAPPHLHLGNGNRKLDKPSLSKKKKSGHGTVPEWAWNSSERPVDPTTCENHCC